jgi:hypothetical protein
MDQEKALRLLLRSATDLLAQTEKLLKTNDPSDEAIGSLTRYAAEVKRFILEKIRDEEILALALELPDIRFTIDQVNIFQYYFLLRSSEKKRQVEDALECFAILRSKYSSIEFLVRDKAGIP